MLACISQRVLAFFGWYPWPVLAAAEVDAEALALFELAEFEELGVGATDANRICEYLGLPELLDQEQQQQQRHQAQQPQQLAQEPEPPETAAT